MNSICQQSCTNPRLRQPVGSRETFSKFIEYEASFSIFRKSCNHVFTLQKRLKHGSVVMRTDISDLGNLSVKCI